MESNDNKIEQFGGSRNPRIWSGIILLVSGGLLLAYKMGAPIPGWFFTWPMLLIAIGLISGFKSGFRNPGGLIMIVIGGIFLIDQTNPDLKFHDYILPAILICVGIVYILRPRHAWGRDCKRKRERKYYAKQDFNTSPETNYLVNAGTETHGEEFIEINAVFGSVKKIILSKNFKGGEINCFMAGTEINFLQADLQKQVTLEINNVFGGTKLIVPSNWDVKNEVTAVFGGIEDKRNIPSGMGDPGKVLVIHGTCIFGGIEIINF